jgi:multidrug resistance protein
MLPIGLLPPIARTFGVSLPAAGLLLTIYALVVVFAGPPLTALLGGLPRKPLLLGLVGILAASTGAAALAPSYGVLLVARVCNALGHGVFWSIVASSAASIVPPPERARAVAIVYAGSSLGIILGVPFGTFVGERFGWHAGFWCVCAMATLAFAALAASGDLPPARASSLADIRALLVEAPFVRILLSTTLVVVGNFTAFSYFAPLLVRDDAGRAGGVSLLLLAYGIAGFFGNLAFGALAQRRGVLAIAASAGLMFGALVTLAFDRGGTYGTLALVALVSLWGLGTGGVVVALQTRVLAAQPDRPDVASALNSSAFNLGIGGGAFVGGLVLRAGGLGALPVAAALLIAPAIALQLATRPRA